MCTVPSQVGRFEKCGPVVCPFSVVLAGRMEAQTHTRHKHPETVGSESGWTYVGLRKGREEDKPRIVKGIGGVLKSCQQELGILPGNGGTRL